MIDRELLELAAKAAGIEVWFDDNGTPWVDGDKRVWNPLTDDGDALRLAVQINTLDLLSVLDNYGDADLYNKDPQAATRRAIVRAAAEIGRSMK
jgi:hypothetical protein